MKDLRRPIYWSAYAWWEHFKPHAWASIRHGCTVDGVDVVVVVSILAQQWQRTHPVIIISIWSCCSCSVTSNGGVVDLVVLIWCSCSAQTCKSRQFFHLLSLHDLFFTGARFLEWASPDMWAWQLTHFLPYIVIGHILSQRPPPLSNSERAVVQIEHARVVKVNDFELGAWDVFHRVRHWLDPVCRGRVGFRLSWDRVSGKLVVKSVFVDC